LTVDIDYVDPALWYYVPSWTIAYATSAMLLNYPHAPAPRGSRLTPEVAQGFPRISRNGLVYTFRLKNTYRLSNGLPVTARNFAAALNRDLNRRMSSPAQPFIEDIAGAQAVIAGRARTAHGIRVLDPYTLEIRLTRRAPDLLARLAMPFFAAIPRNLPVDPQGVSAPVHSAGPYYVREWTRNRRVILERNRFYRGPVRGNVNRIQIDIGLPLETIKLNIDRGATDFGDLPPSAHAELGRRFGVRHRSPGRYFANPSPTILYLAMNHDRRLFGGGANGNLRLKKAVNFAIDRQGMLSQLGAYGGVTNDQYMPPTMRGFRNIAVYPRRPNLAQARRLAAGQTRGGDGVFYCFNRSPGPETCQIVQANLRNIGLDMDIKLFPPATLFALAGRRGEPFDLTGAGWHMDYFDPYDFIFLVDGTTIRPANNVNLSYFHSPSFDRKIARAKALVGVPRYRAFSKLDHELVRDVAPLAVYGSPNARHYVSARVGCYHYHPVFTWDYAALCVTR
ncbi:MAG TPA: ABC transporter substrate-binding protein, partial [Gaiellaceae bacterium]|nr:ABC transporter substrate-binding protein [Gaiellaceae bacterium]HET8652268.1 ABC transporter substrate-binding protein [Gaiellaceae bacterium]